MFKGPSHGVSPSSFGDYSRSDVGWIPGRTHRGRARWWSGHHAEVEVVTDARPTVDATVGRVTSCRTAGDRFHDVRGQLRRCSAPWALARSTPGLPGSMSSWRLSGGRRRRRRPRGHPHPAGDGERGDVRYYRSPAFAELAAGTRLSAGRTGRFREPYGDNRIAMLEQRHLVKRFSRIRPARRGIG